MIDIVMHRSVLLNILKDIYKDIVVASWLGFKGGTALYFFHKLPRFSIDLDFNLLIDSVEFKPEKIEEILKQYVLIKDYSEKQNTFFWLGSYRETHRNIKIEISKRRFSDEYELQDLYGLSIKCLKKPYLFAHKLCAIRDRKSIANRDLFDAHFMFKNNFSIAENIIKIRTAMPTKKYFKALVSYIPAHLNKSGILHGLGDLLDEEQKKWIKDHLVNELLFYLKSRAQI